MQELVADLWELSKTFDAVCVTTNGTLRKNGSGIMGKGVALEAKQRGGGLNSKGHSWMEALLGASIKKRGNVPCSLGWTMWSDNPADPDNNPSEPTKIQPWRWEPGCGTSRPEWYKAPHVCEVWTLPTKNDWRDAADLALIEASIKLLVEAVDAMGYKKIALTRPGCGNGGLSWEQVKPVLEKYLDDRFYVVRPAEPF
jgi:hypothetical protein